MSQFANARNIITDEIRWCLKQTEDLKNTYSEQEKELKVMRLHCAQQEVVIHDMRLYIKQIENRLKN